MSNKIISDKEYIEILERFINVSDSRVARLGFTDADILLILRSAPRVKRFHSFMAGQTCAVDEKLGVLYYIHDTYRFIQSLHGVKSSYWD